MKAYLIPGWGENLKDRDYISLLNLYKEADYEPEFVEVDWNYKSLANWLDEVESKISKNDIKNSLLSGFSFGAMISLLLAAEYSQPKNLLLFSLSPYFADDLPKLKPSWIKSIGKRKIEEFKRMRMEPIAAKIKCPASIFVGKQEGSESENRARLASKEIKGSNLYILDGVKHDVSDPKYLAAIKEDLGSK